MHFANKAASAAAMLATTAAARPAIKDLPMQGFTRPLLASDAFKVLDPQRWENPDDMTWSEYIAPPRRDWSDPTVHGSERDFNIALVAVDYPDRPFTITLAPNSTVYGNPQKTVSGLDRAEVPAFYRDLLNTPQDLNRNHTLHEYWMEDSGGRYGVNLTVFGPYEMPSESYQYGIDDYMNPGGCPDTPDDCSKDLRTDAFAAWADDGGHRADFELLFVLSAGQDESSTWQEFGEMKFSNPSSVPSSFGPPTPNSKNNTAKTRYVPWTSWAAASNIWPDAQMDSSVQAESSGMSTYAHELSHLLGIGDNYNNPFGEPPQRSFTGPWSMLSRGTFNGPAGPHHRWEIPALQGGALGSLHTVRDKRQLGLVASNKSVVTVSRSKLPGYGGVVVVDLAARVVQREGDKMGVRVLFAGDGGDKSPECDWHTDPFCDTGGYDSYEMEVVDRMGADSFCPDSGVMISKTKDDDSTAPFQWTIDANPQDINLVDFVRPNGTEAMLSVGDYRQLADALFHAGTRSGSEFEYVDEANELHMYVLDLWRDEESVLMYKVAIRALGGAGKNERGVEVAEGKVGETEDGQDASHGVLCEFELSNTGKYVDGGASTTLKPYLQSDVYRLEASVDGDGWQVVLPNELAAVEFGQKGVAKVAVGSLSRGAAQSAVVTLKVTSESDASATASAQCKVSM